MIGVTMFLKKLSRPNQKLFLELACYSAKVDNEFNTFEKTMINEYRKEMDLDELKYKVKNLSFDDILKKLSKSSEQEKKIIFIELIGLVLSDKKYKKQEKTLIENLMKAFEISDKLRVKAVKWVKDLQKFYQTGIKMVMI
jgi:hypothetical protein